MQMPEFRPLHNAPSPERVEIDNTPTEKQW